ncbi:MAG: hypothetical protein ACOZNI_30620 [Myxococcota bacterium]
MTRTLPLALLLAACSSGTPDHTEEAIADYEAAVEDARTLVADHAAAVEAASTLEDVAVLEASYATDWQAVHDRMRTGMDGMDGCEMDDEGMGMMDDADMSMGEMDTEVDDHVDAHGTHADLAECAPEEERHGTVMTEHLDEMIGHGDHWRDSAQCGDMGGSMEM